MKAITFFLLTITFAMAFSTMFKDSIGAGIGAGLLGIAVAISNKEE